MLSYDCFQEISLRVLKMQLWLHKGVFEVYDIYLLPETKYSSTYVKYDCNIDISALFQTDS